MRLWQTTQIIWFQSLHQQTTKACTCHHAGAEAEPGENTQHFTDDEGEMFVECWFQVIIHQCRFQRTVYREYCLHKSQWRDSLGPQNSAAIWHQNFACHAALQLQSQIVYVQLGPARCSSAKQGETQVGIWFRKNNSEGRKLTTSDPWWTQCLRTST